MQFANYTAFRTAVSQLIEGDDTSGNTFSVGTLNLLIGLGEGRVYNGDNATQGLRASSMIESASVAVSSNAADLPADLLALKEVISTQGRPIEVIGIERMRDLLLSGIAQGNTVYCAHEADSLIFWPEYSGNVTLNYYARPDDIKDGLHDTFNRYPELFIYASLFEAALYMGMDARLPAWEAKYRQLADGANHSERMRVYDGSRLRQRAS
jgi:hypothetical protein